MKKKLGCLLLALTLLLCGCGSEEEAVEELSEETLETEEEVLFADTEVDAEDIWESEDVPAPEATPEPTPIPEVSINSYTYTKVTNREMDVSFKYPSHWTCVEGTYTLSYVEPVAEGEVASRMSVTVKDYEGTMTKSMLQQEAKDFSAVISTTCDKYDRDHVGTDVEMLGHSAYSFQYTGEIDGQDIRGFAIVGFGKENGKLYALNFYSAKGKFVYFDIVRRVILNSLTTAS